MDPEANIREQVKLAKEMLGQLDREEPVDEIDVARLCELVEALDQWMCRSGFLPKRWAAGR